MEKNCNIEFLRFISTIAVCLLHIGICWISFFKEGANEDSIILFSLLQTSMLWAVPVFVMITGYLLMPRNISYVKAFEYFKRILVLLLFFGGVFSVIENVYIFKCLDIKIILKSCCDVFMGESWEHLWYLYMLLGLYLILPILCSFNKIPLKEVIIFFLITLTFCSLLPSFNINIGIDYPVRSVYLCLFLIGYFFSIKKLKDRIKLFISNKLLFVILCLITIVTLLLKYYCLKYDYNLNFKYASYSSIFTIIQSAIIFYLVIDNKKINNFIFKSNIIKRFNRCSLGIYITHMIWINLFIKLFHINIMLYNPIIILPSILIILFLSWLTTEILIKCPLLKNYL